MWLRDGIGGMSLAVEIRDFLDGYTSHTRNRKGGTELCRRWQEAGDAETQRMIWSVTRLPGVNV